MNKVNAFFQNLSTEIGLPSFGRKVIIWSGMIFFVVSIINISAMLYETRATKGMVYAKDNDAGRGVQTATLTRWWNSNHFAPYGNLYFRFAHSLAKVVPSDSPENLHPHEVEEMQHHFALMLTSLLFLSALSLFLGYLITRNLLTAPWPAVIFLNLGVLDPTWVEFLFRVHPDHTLMFFCIVSAYFTLKYTHSATYKDFLLAAISWGLATAVKRSTVLFIPAFIYLFLSEGFNKQSLKKGMQFAGYMLLAYLIIGFPQNFGFYKHTRFLYIETYNSIPVTKESILDYLSLIFNQSRWFWIAIISMHFLFGVKENLMNKRFVIFCAIALLVVLASNMSTNHNHHIMPHVATFFVLFIFSLKLLPVIQFPKKLIALCIFGVVSLILLPESQALKSRKAFQNDCRKEILDALELVGSFQKDNRLLVRDPYFPFSATYKEMSKQIWGVNGEVLDNENAYLWGTRRDFLRALRLKPYRPHIYPDLTLEQWNAKLDLALKVQTESQFVTPKGAVFEKILDDRCGYMVWKRKE